MEIMVLGCSGGESPGHRPPSFLLKNKIIFDTGGLTHILDIEGQLKVKNIFITHPHLDHILGIPFLADSLIFRKKRDKINIFSLPSVIKTIRKSLLDGSIWPDFTVIPNTYGGILNLIELKSGRSIKMEGYTITPYPVNHSVPATGYLVEDGKKRRFFYTGDTGPTDSTWEAIGGRQIHCLIIEASFPNRMEEIAIRTGHLTPRLLKKEVLKIRSNPERIFVTHIKPQYFKTIKSELQKLNIQGLRLLKDDQTIQI
jgi:ribonuclease BN (tRNA processing enzyme)